MVTVNATNSRLVSNLGSVSQGPAALLGISDSDNVKLVTATITFADSNLAMAAILGTDKTGVVPISEFYPNKHFEIGKTYTFEQLDNSNKPLLSVARPEMLELLLAGVSPEIRTGAVRVIHAARIVGIRSKIAVAATEPGVDPVASCLGRQANRISWLKSQLGGERVDVVAYSDDILTFVRNVFAPATVLECKIIDNRAEVTVPQHQHAAAMGGGGLNQILATNLTGLRIFLKAQPDA